MDVEMLPGDLFVVNYCCPQKYFDGSDSLEIDRWNIKSKKDEKSNAFCPFGKSLSKCPMSKSLILFLKSFVRILNDNYELRWIESVPRDISTQRYLIQTVKSLSRFSADGKTLVSENTKLDFFSVCHEEEQKLTKLKVLIKKIKS